MKNVRLFAMALAIVGFALVSFKPVERAVEVSYPEATGSTFISTVCSESLFERFEVQFAAIEEVTNIEAYQLDGFGYYYAVSAKDKKGVEFVEYFKTTENEVNQGIYDYIQLNERTTGITSAQQCREDFSKLPNWCTPYNVGPICGYQPYPWSGCVYY